MKTYGELCPLARALDVVGDRWAMLVVRELVLGPRRYTDLVDGLPGIGTNVLAARLTELQEAGVISKQTLPPPAPATVYQLTASGQALRPALRALSAWGADYGRPPSKGDTLRPSWSLLRTVGRHTTLGAGDVIELRVGADVFSLTGSNGGLVIESGARQKAGAQIVTNLDGLVRLLTRPTSPPERQTGLALAGDVGAARRALETLAGALSSPPDEGNSARRN